MTETPLCSPQCSTLTFGNGPLQPADREIERQLGEEDWGRTVQTQATQTQVQIPAPIPSHSNSPPFPSLTRWAVSVFARGGLIIHHNLFTELKPEARCQKEAYRSCRAQTTNPGAQQPAGDPEAPSYVPHSMGSTKIKERQTGRVGPGTGKDADPREQPCPEWLSPQKQKLC